MNKYYRTALLAIVPLALLLLGYIAIARMPETPPPPEPWQELRPFWGERPKGLAGDISTRYNGCIITAHRLRNAEDWVSRQCALFSCRQVTPNAVDQHLITLRNKHANKSEPCTVWRSKQRYDLERTHYQAVQPTFILFANGDCLFYLYDRYNHESLDAIPPPCRVLKHGEGIIRNDQQTSVNLSCGAAKA